MVLADSDGIPRVPPYSGALSRFVSISYTGLSPSLVLLPIRFYYTIFFQFVKSPSTPICMHIGLGFFLFARRYLGNRFFFLFLQVLRCFSSLRYLAFCVPLLYLWWVPPFGYLWIFAYLQLPKAFRRLSRPSSAPSAKAFTVRSFLLNRV